MRFEALFNLMVRFRFIPRHIPLYFLLSISISIFFSALCLFQHAFIFPLSLGAFNIYNIYDECGQDQRRRKLSAVADTAFANADTTELMPLKEAREILSRVMVEVDTKASFTRNAGYGAALNDYSCGEFFF
jgi:hypothetical protein